MGKEVFEKTGRIREGVGQSSTRPRQNVIPQEEPVKSHQGIKEKQKRFEQKQKREEEC